MPAGPEVDLRPRKRAAYLCRRVTAGTDRPKFFGDFRTSQVPGPSHGEFCVVNKFMFVVTPQQ